MDYVTSMAFDQLADFRHLKQLVMEAAYDSDINIHDNAFDWSLILVNRKM